MIAGAPLAHYFCYFQVGREGKPIGFNMVGTDLCFLLIIPIIVGLAAAILAPVKGTLVRLEVGLAALLVTPILVFFAPPAPVVIYTHGFERAIETDVGIARLQQWAEEALARFHQGAFSTNNAASYWSAGNVVLLRSDLPPFLTTGLFAPSGDPYYGPEISIRPNNGLAGDCIALCWYDHGLLVGSPQFRSDWRTDYRKQLMPGIYSYYSGK